MNDVCADIKKQFNRVKGQINGIDKMINEGRDYLEIIQQISAAKSALSSLAVEMLKDESKNCFKTKKDEQKIQQLEELVEKFFKVA